MSQSNSLPSVATVRDAMTRPELKNALSGLTVTGRTVAVEPIKAAAFYSAIVLPLVYLPMLAGGISTGKLTVLVGLLLANAAALVLGHDYGSN